MKKWIFIGAAAVLIAVAWLCISVYRDAQVHLDQEHEAAADQAKQAYNIGPVIDVESFHGTNSYQVVKAEAQGAGDKKVYILIPDDAKLKPIYLKADEGITRGQLLKKFKEETSYGKIISVKLGVFDGEPAWEITYKSKGAYVFAYYRFEDGEKLNKIQIS